MSILRNRQPGRQYRRPRYHTRLPAASAPTPFLSHALAYASRGWSCIPVIGKNATASWKEFQQQPPDEDTLQRLFARPGITGIAVITGSVSGGLAVRDFDQATAYLEWAKLHPDEAARVPTAQTARGYHAYGTLGQDCYQDFGTGELRADSKHYVLVPPSIHPDGTIYRWLIPLPPLGQTLPRLPDSLVQETLRQTQAAQETQGTHDTQLHTTCVKHADHPAIAGAIESTLPRDVSQRNRCLFELARVLKGIIPQASREELKAIVRIWHGRAVHLFKDKDFTTSWLDFSRGWDVVRIPKGAALSEVAFKARKAPLSKIALEYDLPAMQQLVALCEALQRHHGPGNSWPLSCRLAGREIGVSHVTAAGLIKLLCADGVIELTARSGSSESRRAAEYRFITLAGGVQ